MSFLNTFRALGPIDARNIRRDSLLRWFAAIPFLFALMFRLLVPWLRDLIFNQFGWDLAPYYVLIMSYGFVLGIPIIFGVVIGFLLLDERDDGTLTALQVTPLSLRDYLGYRVTIPIILSIVLTVVTFPLAGLAQLPWPDLLLVATAAAPLAPIFALVLAALAENKVQGFAIMKGLGVFMILPIIAYFVSEPWQWLFGLIPTYWPTKLYWMLDANAPNVWLVFGIGMAYALVVLAVLMRRFSTVMHR